MSAALPALAGGPQVEPQLLLRGGMYVYIYIYIYTHVYPALAAAGSGDIDTSPTGRGGCSAIA